MKVLNESGLVKLNNYISLEYGDSFALMNKDGKSILHGEKSEKIFEDLKLYGIIFESIGDREYVVKTISEEDEQLDDKSEIKNRSTDYDDEKRIKETVTKMLPFLSQHFATKEEINNALNELRSQLIDPKKLTELFDDMAKKVNK
jgi:hypothetical protein